MSKGTADECGWMLIFLVWRLPVAFLTHQGANVPMLGSARKDRTVAQATGNARSANGGENG